MKQPAHAAHTLQKQPKIHKERVPKTTKPSALADSVQKPRVYAFIDSQNLNLGVQKFGWKMDWRKFRQFLEDRYGVSKAFLFIGYIPENEALYEQMYEVGFAIVLKPTFDLTKPRPEALEPERHDHQHSHGNKHATTVKAGAKPGAADHHDDKKPVKGNVDAELVLWTMKEISNYDKAIIVSGDGDFYSLVEYLESKKRLLHLLTPSGHYSSLYNRFEKYIVQLDTFRKQLAYHDHRRSIKPKPVNRRSAS